MGRLKTNNNIYRAKIEDYILSCINSEDQEINSPEEKINHFFYRYNGEYNNEYNKRQYLNNQDRLASYLMGLPFNFSFMNFEILELVRNLHNIKDLTEKEENTVLANYWNHLALHILRLKDKYLS